MSVEVRTLRGVDALEGLRGAWQTLFASSTSAPFLSWEWLSTWSTHLRGDRVPLLYCVREGGRLIGLLPLAEERVGPTLARRMSLLGERPGGADDLDLIAAPGAEARACDALTRTLLEATPFDLLELDNLPEGSLLLRSLETALTAAGMRHVVEERHTCPYVVLGGSWPELLRESRRGDNFKRRQRQLRGRSDFSFRSITEPARVEDAFERFLALHAARWADQGGSDAMGRATIQEFHRALVVRLAHAGQVRFEELWVEGACRASIYGLERGATYCFYQSGYDPAFAHVSVGLVLLGLSIEAAIARGCTTYDFLHGTERYKFDWARDTRRTMRLRAWSEKLGARLLRLHEEAVGSVRAAAHAVLPTSSVSFLRRMRRRYEART